MQQGGCAASLARLGELWAYAPYLVTLCADQSNNIRIQIGRDEMEALPSIRFQMAF